MKKLLMALMVAASFGCATKAYVEQSPSGVDFFYDSDTDSSSGTDLTHIAHFNNTSNTVYTDTTFTGGAGALRFDDGDETIMLNDDDTTALIIESSDGTDIITVSTEDTLESVTFGGSVVMSGNTSMILDTIRFCGNGPNGATATFIGPVLMDDTEADLAFSGAGCDAADNTTEATADAPWHAGFAFKPVAMACVGLCTGVSPADDAITFQLRDDTADVAGMTCTTDALPTDAVPAQCTVRDTSVDTVAANSAIAIDITMTDDDCNDVGDDFECLVYITF